MKIADLQHPEELKYWKEQEQLRMEQDWLDTQEWAEEMEHQIQAQKVAKILVNEKEIPLKTVENELSLTLKIK